MRRGWSFHTVALASGAAEGEGAARKELLASVAEDALEGWGRRCSFRVVGRGELEERVRATHAEEAEVANERAREEGGQQTDEAEAVAGDVEDAAEPKERMVVTPALMALAFQLLVSQDKREFLNFQQTEEAEGDAETGDNEMQPHTNEKAADLAKGEESRGQVPARVYLLVDYPTSLSEIEALLRLGEAGSASQVTDGPESLPLLPLIDGVVLLADPSNASLPRGRVRSNSTSVLRKSVSIVSEPRVENTVPGMAEVSIFQSCNAVVKTFYDTAQVGGVEWSDFSFTHVNCNTDASLAKETDYLQRELFDTVEALAARKFAFKTWVESTKFCVIPGPALNDSSDLLRTEYESILDGVFPGSIAVSTVLFAITDAVATVLVLSSNPTISRQPHPTSHNNRTDTSPSEEFIENADLVARRIAGAQLCYEALQAEGDPCYLPRRRLRLDDVERAMWRQNDFPGVGNEGRKAMPRVPELSEPERRVRNTELATFYESPRYSGCIVHLTRQLLQVEEMLGSSWRGKLQQREFMERLSRATLPQRIALVLQQNMPDVYSSYYTPTDTLLLACLPKTAPGRLQSSFWVARDHVRHRPAFKSWKSEQLADPEYVTPRTEAAAGACVPLSSGQLALVAKETWSMYPSDHSVVRLYRTPLGLTWLTVYHRGETFGLRSKMCRFNENEEDIDDEEQGSDQMPSLSAKHGHEIAFVGSFQDDSTIHISPRKKKQPKKPDGFSSITVSNSFPSGLIVSACSDGSIAQRYARVMAIITDKSTADAGGVHASGDDANANANSHVDEEYRVIYGKGSVLRVLRCGRKEVMLASGIIRIIHGCGERRHHSTKRTTQGGDVHPPLATTLTLDPETNALVERRPDGAIIVTLTSGARVTYHIDGTRMYLNSGNSHVLVKKQGFADVCIDVEVNMTAKHHAAGDRVAVTKGGLRVRSIVNVYDGTSIEVSYNTKVTAQVNERVTTRKPSGQVIVAKDSGRVEYYAQQPSGANGRDSKDDDDRDVTSHNGVYYFDCRRGHFKLCDNEQNQFHVNMDGSMESPPTVSVDLAGVVSDAEAARYGVDSIPAKPIINEPIQPHIFILNGDGTGVEILRPQDIAECFEDNTSDNQVGELANTIESDATQRHIFLRQMTPLKGTSLQQSSILNDAELYDEMLALQQPVATAGKFLPSYFDEARPAFTQQQFTIVRRIEQIQPLCAEELDEMYAGWARWEQWQKEREANKECYKVVDPRSPEVIAQEVAMQKKVLAAYKATRARKKLARQNAREMKAKGAAPDGLRMETVQEGEEALGGEGEDEEDSDDEFGQFGSDLSDGDAGETAEVDDPMELLWTAFSQADKDGRGLLSVAQTRLGVVNVLGIGVSTSELTEALVGLKTSNPFNVSFDVFADLVAFFRKGDEDNQDAETSSADGAHPIPALKGVSPAQRKELGTPCSSTVAAGSAAEAVRVRGGKFSTTVKLFSKSKHTLM